MIKKSLKTFRKTLKKKRGVSEVVAEILLIGLTLLAGAITFGTVIVLYNSKEPIEVSIDSFSNFKLNNFTNSTKYNSFSFVLDNQGKRAIGVRAQDFQLINNTNGKTIPNWSISRDYDLDSLQSYVITVDNTGYNLSTWISFKASIKIQLIAYGLEDSYDVADKAIISSSTTIDSSLISVGPLQLISNRSVANNNNYAQLQSSSPSNNSISIFVQNYGNLNVNYSLDFMVSNTSISMTIRYSGQSNTLPSEVFGSLQAANGNNPTNSATLILKATTPVSTTNNYYIIIWLKIDTNIQDTLVISCY